MRVFLLSALVLLPAVSFGAEGDGKTARERYEAAVQKALVIYQAEVEEEIKAAGAKGNLEEANRLAEERDTIKETPAEKLMKKLEGTKWVFDDGDYVKFLKDGKAINNRKVDIVWIASDEKTVLQQNKKTAYLFVWKFSEEAEKATRYAFQPTEDSARHPRKSR